MALRVIGAGLGRTGTHSLKLALERLLGAPCYHMFEVLPRQDHWDAWRSAADGRMPDWSSLFEGFGATVDWPAAAFWPELMEAYPDALVLLSVRDPESWWTSAHNTIFKHSNTQVVPERMHAMIEAVFERRFTNDLENKDLCISLFERHNAEVRRRVPASRLLEWRPEDGWAPICRALGVPVPDEPFPHVNTRAEIEKIVAAMMTANTSIDGGPGTQ